ncbi:MAG: hypothetical protein JNL28_14950 [Planctomycetes bacterium]|nr:hypothetical protein [Planctomycetota bacterium]
MSAHRTRLLGCLALALAVAPACSRAYAPADDTEAVVTHSATGENAFALAQAPLFDRLQRAPLTVAHSGVRRLEYHYEIASVQHTLVYEEQVSADGNGRFALDPLRVGEPQMTVTQRETFDLVQKSRQGFFFNYRDFGVRHSALFMANYTITDLNTHPVVAGRACNEFEIKRRTAARVTYRLAVDIETGLILRSVETAPNGNLTATSYFTSITIGPVAGEVVWFDPLQGTELLDTTGQIDQGLKFTPIAPRLVPAGYQLLRSEVVRNGNDPWVRHIYSDGIENIFLLHSGGRPIDNRIADENHGPTRSKYQGASGVAPADTTYAVRMLEAGPWTLAEITRGNEQIFCAGKIGEDEVLLVLRSSL